MAAIDSRRRLVDPAQLHCCCRVVREFFGRGDGEHFVKRGDPLAYEAPAVFGEGFHAGAACGGADLVGRGVLEHELVNGLIGVHPLEDGMAAVEAGLAAFTAADGAVDHGTGGDADLRLEGLR